MRSDCDALATRRSAEVHKVNLRMPEAIGVDKIRAGNQNGKSKRDRPRTGDRRGPCSIPPLATMKNKEGRNDTSTGCNKLHARALVKQIAHCGSYCEAVGHRMALALCGRVYSYG